jgi:protein-disulfide isomerase
MRLFIAIAAFLALLAPASAQYYGRTVDIPELMMAGPLGDKALGDPNAPVTVIEYASMTCPHCQRFHTETYPTLKTKYIDTGKVYFILREFPLDALGFAAFMVARCSGDNYFAVIETLFDHQEEWAFVRDPARAMVGFVQAYGIGEKEFDTCIDNSDIFDHIEFVATRGSEVFGVEGTPTFFFNGNRLAGEIPVSGLESVLNQLLQPQR